MQLIQGDCLQLMSKLPDKSVDMILCDPPYSITSLDWDNKINTTAMFNQYKRVLKDDGNILLFCSIEYLADLITRNRKMFKYVWHWDKQNGGNFAIAKYQPLRAIEYIAVFNKQNAKYYPQMEKVQVKDIRPVKTTVKHKQSTQAMPSGVYKADSKYNNHIKFPKNVLSYNSRGKELNSKYRVHPTQKPVDLLEYLIKTYTHEGELVLDNTMGSGSTGVACINTKRDFIGMELDKEYFRIAEKRIQEAQSEIRLDV